MSFSLGQRPRNSIIHQRSAESAIQCFDPTRNAVEIDASAATQDGSLRAVLRLAPLAGRGLR